MSNNRHGSTENLNNRRNSSVSPNTNSEKFSDALSNSFLNIKHDTCKQKVICY